MADVRLAPEKIVEAGLAAVYYEEGSDPAPGPALLNVSDTYLFANNGRVVIHAKKANAVDCDIVIPTPKTFHGLSVADTTVTVEASGGDKFFGPFDRSLYNNGDGDVSFTLSDVDGLTLALLRI